MIVRLSDTQARVIREAKHHCVNGGPTTMRVHYFRGVRSATFAKLYRLGLITAPHEYADLTDIGVSAWVTLSSDTAVRTVVGGDSCGGAAAVIEQPKPAQLESYRVVVTPDGFAVEDSTDGTYVADGFNSRYPARLEAERLNLAADPISVADLAEATPAERTDVVYASREASDALMARIRKLARPSDPVTEWAAAGRLGRSDADAWSKAKFIECIAALWPKGTTVRGKDTAGNLRTGTVNGMGVSYVTDTSHPNFGRAYVDVTWDEIPGQWAMPRNRPFVDTLTRI